MLRCDCTEILFNDIQGNTPVLSAKTIHLRRISQENHIRRMKTAHERLKSQLAVNMSGFPLLETKGLNSFRTPFPTDRRIQDIPNRTPLSESGKYLSKKLSYSNTSINIKPEVKGRGKCTKFTPMKKTKSLSDGIKVSLESVLATGDAHCDKAIRNYASDCENRIKSSIQSGNENSPSTTEVERASLSNKSSVVSNSTKNRQMIDEATSPSFFTSSVSMKLNASREEAAVAYTAKESKSPSYELDTSESESKNKTPVGENRNSKILQKKQPSASKIPISLTRLARKFEMSSSSLRDCTPGQNGDYSASMYPSKGWSPESTPVKRGCIALEKRGEFHKSCPRSKNTISASSFSKHHSLENSMYPVSTWLDSVVVENEPIKTPNNSLLFTPDGRTHSVCSRHSGSHESENWLNTVDVGEDFGNGRGEMGKSESVGSAEYYDTAETEGCGGWNPDSPDFKLHQRCGGEKWEKGSRNAAEENRMRKSEDSADEDGSGISDIDHSTLSVPSDEDLMSDARKEWMFRQLPDYPNTPYFLRYPRYREQKDDTNVRSDGTEAIKQLLAMTLNRAGNSTPKARKTGKV